MGVTKHLQEKLKLIEERDSKLMNENQALKVRAAVAWEELTPRPDFKKTFDILALSPHDLEGKSSNQILLELTELLSKKIQISSPINNKEYFIRSSTRSRTQKHTTIINKSSKSINSRQNSIEKSFEEDENDLKNKNPLAVVEEYDQKRFSPKQVKKTLIFNERSTKI